MDSEALTRLRSLGYTAAENEGRGELQPPPPGAPGDDRDGDQGGERDQALYAFGDTRAELPPVEQTFHDAQNLRWEDLDGPRGAAGYDRGLAEGTLEPGPRLDAPSGLEGWDHRGPGLSEGDDIPALVQTISRDLLEERSRQAELEPATPSAPATPPTTPSQRHVSPYALTASSIADPGRAPCVEAFLAERGQLEGLRLQEASGLWVNTYVPGDPAIRGLQRRLLALGDAPLPGTDASPLALAESAGPPDQPFDAPRREALSLHLHADRAALEGPSRVLLQVGLRGAERGRAERGQRHVAVVLDQRHPLDASARERIGRLLESLRSARGASDRFSLHVAGPGGGEWIAPGPFRHGQLQVALRRLGEAPEPGGAMNSLEATTREAMRGLALGPEGGLGTNLVLLVTPGPSDELQALERLAHTGALGGITTSTVALSEGADDPLERIALAGQGRRRALHDPQDASRMVRAELRAASEVVARALRVRIRLAPGVRLLEIFGSYRLDEADARRAREAELATDRRLARALGIEADRDPEEDGVQILIPAFYAGDEHIILLDLLAPGPGPIAEASLRYKDLLRVSNGEARAELRLARGNSRPGPAARGVLENRLGHALAEALEEAAAAIARGHREAARARLDEHLLLLWGLRERLPALGHSPRLDADARLLSRYVSALDAPADALALMESLRLAGRRRLLEPLQEIARAQ
ncbi:MAG: hypothetical protein OEY14_17970, partial [Myxococcales bacterium]|nr:hypothetical protein [Myxococcales bacterium]